MSEPRSEFFTASDGVRLHYLSWEPVGQSGEQGRRRPLLVMLHGLRSYGRTFADLVDRLGESWSAVALDARGRGLSEWDPQQNYHAPTYLRDLEDFVDQVAGDRELVVLGHSMGGTTAYQFAAAHPDRVSRLIIEDIAPGSSSSGDGAARIRREMSAIPKSFANRGEVEDYWRSLRPGISAEALESRVINTTVEDENGRWRWRLDMEGISRARLDADRPPPDLWPAVRGLRCPTLVICGGKSDFSPEPVLQEMVQVNPHIEWVKLPGAGHYVHDDRPEEFAEAVRDFLAHPSDEE